MFFVFVQTWTSDTTELSYTLLTAAPHPIWLWLLLVGKLKSAPGSFFLCRL